MHAVQACRSRQERTEPDVRAGRTAAVRNEHSTAIPERARNQPTKRNHPSIRPTSNHETTIINTPQMHQPAQTAITSRQATIRPNSRDGPLALKCGKSSVIVEITPNSAHDARIRQNSAARTSTKSKNCAGTNARNKRDQQPLCGPLPVMQQAISADQGQEEDPAILLTTVLKQLLLQRGQGRPEPVR
ncbi:hypothetical protein JF71_17320 (plasmid) [Bifidobacterium polysaccharolyticum]|nr:hypothetical protein JF71_17320 [Bifidobacterium asteroides]